MEKYDIFVCGAGSAGFCAAVAAAAATHSKIRLT